MGEKEKLSKMKGVYKYVHKKLGVIYIGHSGTALESRIRCHDYEEAFKPYLKDCDIYICPLPNRAVAMAMELLLIDHYRPLLNTASKNDCPYTGKLPELDWVLFRSRVNENTKTHKALDLNTLGARVRERRIELGLTQTQLALKCGYTDKSTIAKIESGRNGFSVSKVAAFAQALQMQPDDLMVK